MNAALTTAESSIPSLAISLQTRPDWPDGALRAARATATYAAQLVDRMQLVARDGRLMPRGLALNVDVPLRPLPGNAGDPLPPKGTRATDVAGDALLAPDYKAANGSGGAGAGTYRVGFRGADPSAGPGTDAAAVSDGCVRVSALTDDHDVDARTSVWVGKLVRGLR
ncbi:broad specificity polyphosphatase/5'/3'-nucleotidase SurE [Streptomyces sp. SAI-144]|uniref:5'/3'-nucleotidase SurE n=1 Tax=Streptomyces sp. SAI-144 TaxID=2940544 RepID=UPI002474C3EC|nr:5'/3'-nucleotidase SurE [Streptomyces sp. SAI-144]MDH6436694.1 broad specificity polyphosphatase/5'/3'-nucleotidase SurE [Streptomyces sp. SAI-144]